MFELDHAIAAWRQRMIAAGIKSTEALDELESHLRDDIEQQMRAGANAAQAFEGAVERLGKAEALRGEFAKAGGARGSRLLRVGCIAFAICVTAINAWALLGSDLNPLERLTGFLAVTIIALYAGTLPYLYRFFPSAVAGMRKAMALVALLGSLWVCLALLSALDIVHLHTGLTAQMLFWTLCAAGVVAVLADMAHARDDAFVPLPAEDAFSPVARQSLEIAREEACGFYHDFIGTEHLLLGVISLEEGTVAKVLKAMGVEREAVRAEIEKVVGPGSEHSIRNTLRYTPRCRRALELAAREAKALKQGSVSAEHIFLGLVLEGSGVAAKVLRNLGVKAERAREQVRRGMRTGG